MLLVDIKLMGDFFYFVNGEDFGCFVRKVKERWGNNSNLVHLIFFLNF